MITAVLLDLSERVARRARKDGNTGGTVTFVWRNPDFTRQSHARSLEAPTDSSQAIYQAALGLFDEVARAGSAFQGAGPRGQAARSRRRFRLIGVRLSNFSGASQQQSLFQIPKSASNLDIAMDAVRNKYGESAIRRARLAEPGDDPIP
jgi:DNA polymerase-4